MKFSIFMRKRIFLLLFVTITFVVIGVLLIFITPNVIYNQSINSIEDELKDYVDNYEVVNELSEGYNLYVHVDGVSTLLTRSGYIEDLNIELDAHLIMWGEMQSTPTRFYIDDFDGDNYVYYIKVLNENQYVVSFAGTAEINNFISLFRTYSITLVTVIYIISIILTSVFFSGQLIKKISFVNPKTNFKNKLSLISFFHKKKLEDYKFAYINVHNFEDIIDSCGINFSDMIIETIGDRITKLFKHNEIYEMNGNEYIIALKDEIKLERISQVFEKEMSGHQGIETYKLRIKIVTIDNRLLSSESIESLIKKFEYGYSLIKAKQDVSILIDKTIISEMNSQIYFQSNLEQALHNEKLINFYQPKVDPNKNKVVGCEALSRWFEDDKFISPTKYINIAEANGLIYDIDILSFRNSCKMIKKMRNIDILEEGFKISTNISPITLKNLDIKVLIKIMDDYQVIGKNVSIEITESIVIDFKKVSKILKDIKNQNITIEIDDFSAGNSSFTILPLLNADYLKLDMAILPTNMKECNETLVYEGLVDLSKKLGFKLISEGVESKEQANYVKKIGVDLIQGYYYSKPLSSDQFIEFVKKFN